MRPRTAGLILLLAFEVLAVTPAVVGIQSVGDAKHEPSAPKVEEAPFSNKDVLALTKANLGDSVVIAKIQQAPSEGLDVSADALISLKKNGVSQPIIEAMIKRVELRNHPAEVHATTATSADAGDTDKNEKPSRWKFWKKGTQAGEHDEPGQKNNAQPASASNGSEIKFFLTEKPAGPYKELGRVSSGKFNLFGISRERPAIDEELRKKAADLGGFRQRLRRSRGFGGEKN
jgi:hypothetical protein